LPLVYHIVIPVNIKKTYFKYKMSLLTKTAIMLHNMLK